MATDRQLSINIEGGGPYGFRLFGGDGDPLVIAKLRRKSKAWDVGLEEGDELLSINDHSCRSISHAHAMTLVDAAGHDLLLRIRRKSDKGQLQVINFGSDRQRSLSPGGRGQQSPSSSSIRDHQQQQQHQQQHQHQHQQLSSSPAPLEMRRQVGRSTDEHKAGRAAGGAEVTIQPWPLGSTFQRGGRRERVENGESFGIKSPLPDLNARWQPVGTSYADEMQFSASPVLQQQQQQQQPSSAGTINSSAASWKPSWQPDASPLGYAVQQPPRTANVEKRNGPQFNSINLILDQAKENLPPSNAQLQQLFHVKVPTTGARKPFIWHPTTTNQSHSLFNQTLSPVEPDLGKTGREVGDGEQGDFWSAGTVDSEWTSADRHKPDADNLPPHIFKILQGSSSATDYDIDDAVDKSRKKVFGDSSFYDDPGHRYPTVDEQIKMARQVALSLTAPINSAARGHRMFMKRKERSDKWIVDEAALGIKLSKAAAMGGCAGDIADPYYNPTPWTGAVGWKAPQPGTEATMGEVPAPPLLPASKMFAPKLSLEDEDSESSKALSAQEFERLRLFSQKTQHDAVAPQVCFSLAEALRQSKGKGGRMFARRQAKSEEWTIEGAAAPDPKVMQKIRTGFAGSSDSYTQNQPNSDVSREGRGGDGGEQAAAAAAFPPINRLKEMLELPKPKMTPWDAVVEHGNVDVAFEHLDGFSFLRPISSPPYSDSVISSLQEATRRKTTPAATLAASYPVPAPSVNSGAGAKSPVQNWNRHTGGLALTGSWSTAPAARTASESSSVFVGGNAGYKPVRFQSSSYEHVTTVTGGGGGGFTDL